MDFFPDSCIQYRANLFRCHRTTVSGLTMISDSRQFLHMRESQTHTGDPFFVGADGDGSEPK